MIHYRVEHVDDSPNKRLLYIGLIGVAAIVPLAVGMVPVGAILSLVSLFCVMLYVRSDRKREETRPGFPVLQGAQIVDGPRIDAVPPMPDIPETVE